MIEDLIEQIIDDRTDFNGSVRIWAEIPEIKDGELVYKEGPSIEEEIKNECRKKGIEVLTERWEVFENPGFVIYALSVAWVEDGEPYQFVTTLRSF